MTMSFARRLRDRAVVTASILTFVGANAALAESLAPNDEMTTTPIHHVIVIIGENRTFDHVYGTYVPKAGQTVLNLLSQHIVKLNGKPGKDFGKATKFGLSAQNSAQDLGGDSGEGTFTINPGGKTPYATLPPPGAAGSPAAASPDSPPFSSLAIAANYEYGLLPGDLKLITTGASGLSGIGSIGATHVPDTRIPNDANLPNGPFWLHGPSLPYDSYTGSPVHRFYQMWQETDCSAASATADNPSGCISDLFPFVETTIAAGTNGSNPPTQYDAQGNVVAYDPATYSNLEGSTSMGYYNVAKGDAPYFKALADNFTISDNNHQGVMGGTGANHVMIGYADAAWYSNEPTTPGGAPPDSPGPATPASGQIEDPNPYQATNNIYAEDGYGYGAIPGNGGSYTNCANTSLNEVTSIVTNYLAKLYPTLANPSNCQAGGYYYLLNNYNPAFVGNGVVDPDVNGVFTLPPIPPTLPHIGDMLDASAVSWAYFGESWNDYVSDPNPETNPAGYLYCTICNPYLYSMSTMTGAIQLGGGVSEDERKLHLFDTVDLYNDLATGNLPAFSIVKPNALNDGHPASSKLDLFESFTHKIIKELKANPKLWKDTAVLITWDEGGGYWDSGYIQPVDYFGDGTRIPLIAVSRYAAGGRVVHTYYDHASIAKFVEANWAPAIAAGSPAGWPVPGLAKWPQATLSTRSRDNLPNPKIAKHAPYAPTNGPAIGNLMDMFQFPKSKPGLPD